MITSQHGRRVFALEIGGLEYRYHSNTPPSSSNLSSTIATDINYIDQEGIVSVSDYGAQVDPSGGVADYDAITITLSIDRRRGGVGDPGIIFGRCGARSAGTRAQISSSVSRETQVINVGTDLRGLSYPRLLHIGGETMRAVSAPLAAFVNVTNGRGVGNTPTQNHSITLEGVSVPEITTEITTFRGRRAKLYMAHRYPSGSTSDYVEVVNGFISESPYVEEGDTVSLSLLPLTALIDTSIADKGFGQTRLLQNHHHYDGVNGSVLEYAMQLQPSEPLDFAGSVVPSAPNTDETITASTFQIVTPDLLLQVTRLLDDFDPSLPSGPDGDNYPVPHPRYPVMARDFAGWANAGHTEIFVTSLTYDASIPGYIVNADSTVPGALTAGEISAAGFLFTPFYGIEMKRHLLGDDEVKAWPSVINDTLVSEGPSSTTGLAGGVAKWRVLNNTLVGEKLSESPYPVHVYLWSSNSLMRNLSEARSTPRLFTDTGTQSYIDELGKLTYPLYTTTPMQRFNSGSTELITLEVSGSDLVGELEIAPLPLAYHQHYESTILVESSLGLPNVASGELYDIVVKYTDLAADEEREQVFKVTHETSATFGGSNVGVLLHIADSNEFNQNSSFGDWPDKDRALIFRGGQLTRSRPSLALLRLLQSGGGDQINGDYDTLGVGLNLNSNLIDVDSFLSADAAATVSFSGNFMGDGQSLRDTFDGILKLLGAVLVMKRDPTTGQSRITLTPIGRERRDVTTATVEAGEWIADPPPHWGIYEDLVTQIRFEYDYDSGENRMTSEILFNNQEAISRYGGERSQITLSLPGVSSRIFGRGAGDAFSYFTPTSARIFNLLSNPLRSWSGSIGTGQSSYLDVGSYIQVSSPHLRGYGDDYGVTDGIGMVRSIRQSLEGEGAELDIITVGISPVNWNSSMRVSSITSTTVIVVAINVYTNEGRDSDFFKAGDVVNHIPRGNQDGAGSDLTILSVVGNTITFTGAHGISSGGGTIEPSTYNASSSLHREDAYLSNDSDIIATTVDAQEYN